MNPQFSTISLDQTSDFCCLESDRFGHTLSVSSTVPSRNRIAPNPESPVWQQIAQWDRRVWASQLIWTRESKMHALNWSEREQAAYIAREVESATKRIYQGAPGLQEIVLSAMNQAQSISDGWTSHDELEAIFYRGARWAQLIHGDKYGKSRTLEYLDDDKETRFNWHAPADAPTATSAAKGFWSGGVSLPVTDEKQYRQTENPDGSFSGRARPMSMTVPGHLDVLLMLAPVMQAFPPPSTRLKVRGDVIELTAINQENSASRLNLDRQSGRVLSLQSVVVRRDEVFLTHEVQSWRAVAGIEVEVPEAIVSYRTREGSPEKYDHRHQLQSVQLNDDVPVDTLAFPLGAQVDDRRLGAKRGVNYVLQSGDLPSLDELKRQRRQQTPLKSRLLSGIAAVAIIAALGVKAARSN